MNNDEEQIRRLIVLYSFLLDEQDYTNWGQTLAEDAMLVLGEWVLKGREEIVAKISAVQPARPGKHMVGPPLIERVDDATAHAFTDMTTMLYGEDGKLFVAAVHRYHDVIRLGPAGWRFAERHMTGTGMALSSEAPRLPTL